MLLFYVINVYYKGSECCFCCIWEILYRIIIGKIKNFFKCLGVMGDVNVVYISFNRCEDIIWYFFFSYFVVDFKCRGIILEELVSDYV